MLFDNCFQLEKKLNRLTQYPKVKTFNNNNNNKY